MCELFVSDGFASMLIGLWAILVINYYWTTVMAENSVTGNCLKAQVVCICLIAYIHVFIGTLSYLFDRIISSRDCATLYLLM